MDEAHTAAPRSAHRVERVLRVIHSYDYRYEQAVRNVVTRLRLLPPEARGAQRIIETVFDVAPPAVPARRYQDVFGNRVVETRHEKIFAHLTFVTELRLENAAAYDKDGRVLPSPLPAASGLPPEGINAFLQPTRLTTPDADLDAVVQEIAGGASPGSAALAAALCRRVYQEMRYTPRSTTVRTTAGEAWAKRQGVCQDYTHALLALCRLSGLPARYVSGFLPGENAMHAWAEVLLPDMAGENEMGDGSGWIGLDPTHDRWVNERYIAIAVGCDYSDVTPTSGTYTGPPNSGFLLPRSRVIIENTIRRPL